MSETDFSAYLADNPRMIGVLFTLFLLVAGTGNAAAGFAITHGGP